MTFSLLRRTTFGALACIATLVAGCGRAPSAGQDPESAANAFFAALEKGDAHAAYDGAAFNFQVTQTFEAFLSNARELGFVGAQPPAWTRKQVQGKEARLDGTVVTEAGQQINISVTLTPEGQQWKLFSLRTGSQEAGQEDRFTVVGTGVGFNDVYHQPMPSQQQLADMVHETMSRFNTAIRQGDFHEFYKTISQQWKDGQRTSGEEASGVTEKMLKDHFQRFTDMKIDLFAVAGLPPVWDQPPLIDRDGLLRLSGHFDAPQFRVNFQLIYAYELPRWKLFGIDVEITK